MGCCGSEDNNRRNDRRNYSGNNYPNTYGGSEGQMNHNHEEIQQKRMEYYNRQDVKNKQIFKND